MTEIELKGDNNISLKKLKIEEAVPLAQLANNKMIADNLKDIFPHPYTTDDAHNFINGLRNVNEEVFGIYYGNQLAGAISIKPQSDVYRYSAEVGYWVGEPFWGKGIASEAVAIAVKYGFEHMKLKRLYAGIFENNLASMKVLERNRFQLEGISKKAVFKNGEHLDEYRYALLNQENED